jgi:hypothetical protein
MNHEQLMGKYTRLRQELAQAYAEPVSSSTRSGLIDRLACELAEIEHALAQLEPQQTEPATPRLAA